MTDLKKRIEKAAEKWVNDHRTGWKLGRDKDAVFLALCEIARQWIYDI